MRPFSHSKLGDHLTLAFSVLLAASAVSFAGYKLYRLQQMDDPPATLGLYYGEYFKPSPDSVEEAADPLITATVSDAEETEKPLRYELLSVVKGRAFVRVITGSRSIVMTLGSGDTLPGAGQIQSIERNARGWRMMAGTVTLELGEAQ